VADLTPDRLACLRACAGHRNPAWPVDQSPDDTGCPWCHEVDGSAHDLAVELLDEIARLRAIVEDVAAEGAGADDGLTAEGRTEVTRLVAAGWSHDGAVRNVHRFGVGW
jgi:hypothetical protein